MQEKLSKNAINTILSRLKEYFKVRTDTELASCLEIKQNTISSWKSRGMVDLMLIISKCDNVSYDWLLKGIADNVTDTETAEDISSLQNISKSDTKYRLRSSVASVSEQLRPYKANLSKKENDADSAHIPLYDIDAISSLSALFADSNRQTPLSYLSIPNLPACDGAIYIRGEQMYPLLKSGDIVLYKQLSDIRNIIWGETYLISFSTNGDEYMAVKIINKATDSDKHVILTGYNESYAPVRIPLSSIDALAIVKAFVHFNTMK